MEGQISMLLVLIGNSNLFGCIIVVFQIPRIGVGLIEPTPKNWTTN